MRLQSLDQPAGKFAVVVIDHRDRNIADDLAEIGLRVEHRVHHRCQHKQSEHPTIAKHAAPFGCKCPCNAPCRSLGFRFGIIDIAQSVPRNAAEAQPDQQGQHDGQPAQHGERLGRDAHRRAARGLVEQNLHVPSKRQDRAPRAREPTHRQHRKTHTGIAKSRRDDQAGQTETERHVARQHLHQAADHLVGNDQQRRGRRHQQGTAAKADAEPHVENAHHQHEHQHVDDVIGQQLADQRGGNAVP